MSSQPFRRMAPLLLPLLWAAASLATTAPHTADTTPTAPTPVIVDTDMGFDDWMAILYLLNNPKVEIKAITVDCAGETYCPQGAVNATRLIEIAGKTQIPVFYGEQPRATLAYQYPTMIRYGATTMEVSGFDQVKGVPFYTGDAAGQLVQILREAGEANTPITVLSIGSSTNLAAAIALANQGDATSFTKGVKRIVKGGGAVGKAVKGRLTNTEIKGNINIPTIFSSDNTTAEWNIYPNATAAETLFSSGLPLTLVPLNLSDDVPITEDSFNRLSDMAKSDEARFVVQVIIDNVQSQGGWSEVELDYWDPSVVVSAINPELVTEQYDDVALCVDTAANRYHGTTYVNADGMCDQLGAKSGPVDIYTKLPLTAFETEFFGVLNR